MTVFGIDEAGRGPILGPMAIAVVALDRRGTRALEQLGVADSKTFGAGKDARTRRRELVREIRGRASSASYTLVRVEQIDDYTFRGQLNALEREVVCKLLRRVKAARDARIICDGEKMFAPLRRRFPALEAVDRGEDTHVAVAAASILAKHARDRAFAAIARRYEPEFGEIRGGGYVNAATRRFLDAYEARYGTLPPEARKSWGADKNLSLF